MNEAKLRRELARWYELKPHPVQLALITDAVRFKVVPAGRRSGKTERAKRHVVKRAYAEPGNYFVAAPTRDQVKRIYWDDLKALCLSAALPKQPSETDLIIFLPNGSKISLIGLDKSERIEGANLKGGIVDEIADTKEDAWPVHIKPALDTFDPLNPRYRSWCWLIGVPDGLNHYFDLAEYARTSGDADWKLYTWKSSEILPPDVIEAAQRSLSLKQFKQEYEASFETASGRVYEDYSDKNVTTAQLEPHEQILWCHDFNFTPLSSAICTRRGTNQADFYVLDEIVLESAVARQAALEFVERYKTHQNRNVIIFGDPAGKAGEKHGHPSDYNELEQVLRENGWKVTRQVKAAAPAIKDRQNAVRAKVMNARGDVSLYVNASKARYAHKGMSTTQVKEGSTFQEVESQYQHITTALGYCIEYLWPIVLNQPRIVAKDLPTANLLGGAFSGSPDNRRALVGRSR